MKKSIIAITLLFVGFVMMPSVSFAQSYTGPSLAVELEGFAWSGYTNSVTGGLEGVGWISMNCSNTNTCVDDAPSPPDPNVDYIDYNVQIETDGTLTGHAWSPNVGWIQFGGLSSVSDFTSFPSGNGTTDSEAQAEGVYPDLSLTGWARACSATVNAANPALPGDCSSMTTDTNSGGWDGWISLSGTATNGSAYGVTMTDGLVDANSFAWGGPITMGWIDFAPTGDPDIDVRLANNINIAVVGILQNSSIPDPVTGLVNITLTPNVTGIPVGEDVQYKLLFAGSEIVSGRVEGEPSDGVSFDSPLQLTDVPFNSTDLIRLEVNIEGPDQIIEDNYSDNIYEAGVSIPAPAPTITITGPEAVRAGETAMVSWEISSLVPVTCTISGPGMPATPATADIGSPASGNAESSALNNTTRFTVSCTAGSETYTETYLAEVIPTYQEI